MQEGKRPITVGFFFSLGHSTIVIVASLLIASTASGLEQRFPDLIEVGGVIGTSVSVLFLFSIAIINIVVLTGVYRLFRRVRAGQDYADEELNAFLVQRGVLGRLLHALFRLTSRGWHMYPLGLLFGLGFDTATKSVCLASRPPKPPRGSRSGRSWCSPRSSPPGCRSSTPATAC
jgi:nickel/cobalt transporter (NiCoT) family protein